MELPKYPQTEPERMPDESPARQAATALLVLEAGALAVSLPLQLLLLLSLGWEGGDQALKHRLVVSSPLLGLGALVAAVLAGVAASEVWRDRGDATSLVTVDAVLVLLLGAGWAAGLRGHLVDPMLGPLWLILTLPAPIALALVLVVRARRDGAGSGL